MKKLLHIGGRQKNKTKARSTSENIQKIEKFKTTFLLTPSIASDTTPRRILSSGTAKKNLQNKANKIHLDMLTLISVPLNNLHTTRMKD